VDDAIKEPRICLVSRIGPQFFMGNSGLGSATALWTSLSIRMWQPFLAMKDFLKGGLSEPATKVKLVQRDEVRDKLGSNYMVPSVLLDHSAGRVEVHPYLQSGFF
jgi:hypothetical protein